VNKPSLLKAFFLAKKTLWLGNEFSW